MPKPIRLTQLAVALMMMYSSVARAQSSAVVDPAKQAAIMRILELTNAADQVIMTMELAIPAQRVANPAIPDVFWDRFIKKARQTRTQFIDAMVPIYDRQFNLSELNEIVRFYSSPIGKSLVAATPQITREAMLEGQKWGIKIGQELTQELTREGVLKE